MRVPSRLQALILVASLAGASFGTPGAALAQSAGDEQYQDPLAGETQTTPATTGQTTPSAPDPSTVPQLSPGTSSSTPANPSTLTPTAPTTPSRPLPSALPNTGLDGRILAAIGLGMLLCGVGLRLRTARERF